MPGEIGGWLFENEHMIRVAERQADPWFVAPDVCKALALKNVSDALGKLDEDEKGLAETETLGGLQRLSVVSEPGLYKLVSRSNKPVAKRFDRWVRHEVLPAIRKTGHYGPQSQAETTFVDRPHTFDDWTAAELNSKVGAVAEYRMSIGPQAGTWAMRRFGFPMPPAHLMGGKQFELNFWHNSPGNEGR